MTDESPAPAGPTPTPAAGPELVTWVRHPADVARMVLAVVVWSTVTGFAALRPARTRGLSVDLVTLVDRLPGSVSGLVVGLIQVAAVVVPFAALLLARRARWRELAQALVAAGATGVVSALTGGWFADSVPNLVLQESQQPSWVTGAAFPSASYLAAVAAAVTVVAPTLTRSWRRVVWWTVAVVALARVITAVSTPSGLVASIAVGVFCGSAVMVIGKSPLRSPAPGTIWAALARAGVVAADVRPTATRHRHGPTYVADVPGGRCFVKVVGRDERNAQLLDHVVRAMLVNSPEDRPTGGAEQTVDHEALLLGLAARAGARVPQVVAVGTTDDRACVLALELVEGTPLDEVDDPSDALLADAFAQLAALHRRRLAHGWPSLHHLLATGPDEITLVDLRWATSAATDRQLAADLAELVAAVATAVGPERAVAAAAAAFAPEELGAALPYVQALAVSPETRRAAKGDKELFTQVRDQLQARAGVEAYEMAELQRLSLQKIVTFVGTLVMAAVLLTLVGNAAEIWGAITEMAPEYLPVLLVLGLLSYPAGALSLMGSVTERLPFLRTTEVMFAQSFLNRFTPANAGGMALRTRYLQLNGATLLTAASAVGLTSAASGVMQVVVALVFFTWAGQDDTTTSVHLPSAGVVLLVLVGIGALLGVLWATTWGRSFLTKAWASIRSSLGDFRELARRPSRLFLLFAGAGLSKLVSIVALAETMRAFGVPVDFAAVGAMYITATTVASAVPTPGGVGAIEAALTAGLTGLGVPTTQAAAIVVVFRLFTYWFPTVPSWMALNHLQRRGLA